MPSECRMLAIAVIDDGVCVEMVRHSAGLPDWFSIETLGLIREAWEPESTTYHQNHGTVCMHVMLKHLHAIDMLDSVRYPSNKHFNSKINYFDKTKIDSSARTKRD